MGYGIFKKGSISMKKVLATIMAVSLFGTIFAADTSFKLTLLFFCIFVGSFLAIAGIEKRELKREPKYIKKCVVYHYDINGNLLNR